MNAIKILLVDDERDILEFLSYNLKKESFEIYTATNGIDAVKMAGEIKPQLILLDVMMPGMDGIAACEKIRENKKLDNTVIAFLTARSEDYSQIAGFNAGADDYIAKPIQPKVLISRVKALLKRIEQPHASGSNVKAGNSTIVIDKERFVVIKNGEEIILPRKEFELLSLLYSKPQKVFTREEIYTAVWGEEVVVGDRTIDVHIRRLREKIGEEHIRTLKGVGYKFVG